MYLMITEQVRDNRREALAKSQSWGGLWANPSGATDNGLNTTRLISRDLASLNGYSSTVRTTSIDRPGAGRGNFQREYIDLLE